MQNVHFLQFPSCFNAPKHSSHKSAIDGSNQETGDEESARNPGTVSPAGNKIVDDEHDTKCRECESTC